MTWNARWRWRGKIHESRELKERLESNKGLFGSEDIERIEWTFLPFETRRFINICGRYSETSSFFFSFFSFLWLDFGKVWVFFLGCWMQPLYPFFFFREKIFMAYDLSPGFITPTQIYGSSPHTSLHLPASIFNLLLNVCVLRTCDWKIPISSTWKIRWWRGSINNSLTTLKFRCFQLNSTKCSR